MDSIMNMEHDNTLSSVKFDPKANENNTLLPRGSQSNVQHRDSEHSTNDHELSHVQSPSFSIEGITARRRGKRVEDEKLPKKIRSFYQKQDKLISTFERIHRLHSHKDSDEEKSDENDANDDISIDDNRSKQKRKRVSLYTKISLLINIGLLIAKLFAAIISHSISVVSSVVDSGVDLASGLILFWATRAIKHRDPFMYPQGRTRLEPLSIVILSVIMCSASVQVISESLHLTVEDVKAIRTCSTNCSSRVHPIDMSKEPVAIMISTIGLKLFLFFICTRESDVTLKALAQDHRNDVFSNTTALLCGYISFVARKNPSFTLWLVLIDPIGALLISLYILITWIRQANQQVKRLTGYTATPEFLQQITWITFHHSPLILKIDTVRAFHFGTHFLVEVDIVLPEEMSLKEAHDIGEELQKKIERIPEVERAFVHLDYEFYHKASDEHKVV